MNRLAKYAVASLAIVPAMVFAQSMQTIYKFVDESGRVTYANSPIKGGAKVDLEPLTVIPSSPSTFNTSIAQAPAARAIPVAKVTSVPSPAYSITATPVAFTAAAVVTAPITAAVVSASAVPPPTTMAALDIGENAQQRRADVRQRILQNEIHAEEKSLDLTRMALAEEQRRSGDMRAMRASLSVTTLVGAPQKMPISPDVRAEIERHFERVRNLQDEVAMHEDNITALREEMVARK